MVTPALDATGPSMELGWRHLRVISVMGKSPLIPGPCLSAVWGTEQSPRGAQRRLAPASIPGSGGQTLTGCEKRNKGKINVA